MASPTENWPKGFLLKLHEEAILHGFVWLRPISEEDAKSITSRIYRIRRRSDKALAAFIKPEFHLVMVGRWEPENNGQLPIIYDRRPDGKLLPAIIPATESEKDQLAASPLPAAIIPDISLLSANNSDGLLDNLQPGIPDGDIDSFIDSLRKNR